MRAREEDGGGGGGGSGGVEGKFKKAKLKKNKVRNMDCWKKESKHKLLAPATSHA